MEFVTYSHRNAETIFMHDDLYRDIYMEIEQALHGISDEELINTYDSIGRTSKKSLSQPINRLIKQRLYAAGWECESRIFNDSDYIQESWRLDFAKVPISVEVAFNHQEAIAWNLIKPVMASELNHVEKAIKTSAGVVITATAEMAEAGNFDRAIGTFENFVRHLIPMYNILPSPLLLIGLKAPSTFRIDPQTKTVVYI